VALVLCAVLVGLLPRYAGKRLAQTLGSELALAASNPNVSFQEMG
jgi:hypothetical protein